MNLKLGILIPQSNSYPTIGRDYVDGLLLATEGSSVEVFVEGIGFGADMEQIINATQKLLNQQRVPLITGLLGHLHIERLLQVMESNNTVLLYSDLGATLPIGLKKTASVFCNSFDLYHACYEAAKNVIAEGYDNLAVSSCYYDAGYGFTSALEKGLYQHGGSFSGHYITPHVPRDEEPEIMSQTLEQTVPKSIYAQYSGIFAREHAGFLNQNKVSLRYPFYASHFAVENDILNDFPEIFHGTRCVTSWMVEEKNKANQEFVSKYMDEYERQPSVFSLLGYENGKAIASVSLSATKYNAAEIKKVLQSVEFESPRGLFHFDAATHRTCFNQALWSIEFRDGKYGKTKKAEFPNDKALTLELTNQMPSHAGGWFNAYLCQ